MPTPSPVVVARLVAFAFIGVWAVAFGLRFGGTDAVTYLAAGERLNAGHPLYALSPGDRQIMLFPPYWDVPLLSPPPIAVAFRPLALLGEVIVPIWTILTGLVVLGAAWLVARDGPRALFVGALGMGIALAAISGNVSSLFLAGYLAVWHWRDRPWIGLLIGVMGATKLLPFVLVGFVVARRDVRALGWCVIGVAITLAVSLAGAGLTAHLDYLGVIARSAPQAMSIGYLTGLPWVSPVLLGAGTLLAAVLPERWSYRLCILTIVFAAPLLTVRELAPLIALIPTLPVAFRTPRPALAATAIERQA